MKRYSISNAVPIVGDGSIATNRISSGKRIPVVIVDCSDREDILRWVEIHQDSLPGDVRCRWGVKPLNKRYAVLTLKVLKPVEIGMDLVFDLRRQAALADHIVQSNAVYIQPATYGRTVTEGLGRPKIIVEVPRNTTLANWDNLIISQIAKSMRARGVGKKGSKVMARRHLEEIRARVF